MRAVEPILEVRDLQVYFPVYKRFFHRLLGGGDAKVHAVDGVSFSLRRGEILGLAGESGCGKSTVARTLVGLAAPTGGQILFEGRDVTHPTPAERVELRRRIQVVFQDPHAALNPAITVGEAIADVLRTHGIPADDGGRTAVTPSTPLQPIVDRLFEDVGLHPADQFRGMYPKELSGGQKQRVVIGRVLALRPSIVVADEPVAMLDMSIRAHILRLLLDLRDRYGLTYLFITHDLATAKLVCERVAIMYLGQIAEIGPTRTIYEDPKHPYTRALLQAIPIPDPTRRHAKVLPKGEVPSAVSPPAGCRFHPRCPVATPDCGWEPADVLDLLERRAMDPGTARRDSEAIGPIDKIKLEGPILRLPARESPERTQAYLEELLRGASDALRGAVRGVAVSEDGVAVEFNRASDPGLRKVGDRDVRCVLY